MTDQSEWVSLSEAAVILGVHPTTVRHWADSGDLPSQRTPGGHRRFRRRDLMQWASIREAGEVAPSEVELLTQNALGRARLKVGDGQLEGLGWYDQFNEETRTHHRALGRRLLDVLIRYLSYPELQPQLLAEIREMGGEYARVSYSHQISLSDSIRAFLFFRDLLTESVIQMAEVLSLHTPHDWSRRLQQVNRITDELLLALIDEFSAVSRTTE